MRKILMVGIMAFALIATSGLAVAATSFESHWSGSGEHELHFYSGDDAENHFWTGGNSIYGDYYATDYDDNPYNYNVDTSDVKIDAHVINGGYIEYRYERLDSRVGMYGNPGETSYTYIGTDDTADFKWKTWSNYASLKCSNYGWQSNDQIKATGNHYIEHWLSNNDGEGAGLYIEADGTSKVTCMSEETWGKASSFNFGKGCGCYTNARVDITGNGVFDLKAYADNSITTDFGITTDGYLNVHSEFSSGFHFANFALSGN